VVTRTHSGSRGPCRCVSELAQAGTAVWGGQPEPGAAQDARAAGALVAQVVGRIGQAGADHPARDNPDAALAGARLADANPHAVVEDAKADLHGETSSGYSPYLVRSCSALARQAAASSANPVAAALARRPS
jgi:hypothetical protein